MSRLNWSKWGSDFLLSLMRHVGTATATWGGVSFQDGKFDASDLHSLWIAILAGAIIPTVATYLQKGPEEDTAPLPPPPNP